MEEKRKIILTPIVGDSGHNQDDFSNVSK